jgi:hypothetical protein
MTKNGKLDYKTCCEAGSLGIHKIQRPELYAEWKDGTVSSFGDSDEQQM